jgi:hypothetical protein
MMIGSGPASCRGIDRRSRLASLLSPAQPSLQFILFYFFQQRSNALLAGQGSPPRARCTARPPIHWGTPSASSPRQRWAARRPREPWRGACAYPRDGGGRRPRSYTLPWAIARRASLERAGPMTLNMKRTTCVLQREEDRVVGRRGGQALPKLGGAPDVPVLLREREESQPEFGEYFTWLPLWLLHRAATSACRAR